MFKKKYLSCYLFLFILLLNNSYGNNKKVKNWVREFKNFADYIENNYRPLEYKENLLKFKFGELTSQYESHFFEGL